MSFQLSSKEVSRIFVDKEVFIPSDKKSLVKPICDADVAALIARAISSYADQTKQEALIHAESFRVTKKAISNAA